MGLLFGNALAMAPLGQLPGMAAAVIGSLSTLMSVALGAMSGQLYDDTPPPLAGALTGFGALAVLVVR